MDQALENPLKTKLSQGRPVFGIWSLIPSPIVTELFTLGGMDFQILDMEHGVFDMPALDASIRACEAAGGSPLVRTPGVAPFVAQAVMDLGAHGVIVPQVSDAQSAKAAVDTIKYSPEGVRGYNPFTRAALYSNPATNEFGKLNNRYGFASVIIENKSAYEALDRILEIPALDMIYLGIYDMAVSLGCKGDTSAPEITAFVAAAARKGRAAGKAVGMLVKSRQEMTNALSLGANFLVYAVDTFMIRKMASDAVAEFRAAASDALGGTA